MSRSSLLVLLLSIPMLVSCQEDSCFQGILENSVKLLHRGDTVSFDLDMITTGQNLQFRLEVSPKDPPATGGYIQQTFPATASHSNLLDDGTSGDLTKCTRLEAGIIESNMIMLCDKTKIVFFSLHTTNGTLKSVSMYDIADK